jgi:type I restriction enzyme R subunit
MVKLFTKKETSGRGRPIMDQKQTPNSTLVLLTPEFNVAGFYRKVKRYILVNQDNEIISRIRHNKPISPQDIEALEKVLFDGGERGTKEDFVGHHDSKEPLGYFVRSIVGLDQDAAMDAFEEFLVKSPLDTVQKAFVNLIIDYVTTRGVMEPERLFEHPFTEGHPQGVLDVFDEAKAQAIMDILRGINRNAIAVQK